MIRIFDIILSAFGIILSIPILFIVICISFFETRSPLFVQERVGYKMKPFKLIKLRTMKRDTPIKASHLVGKQHITAFGTFLRKWKIDELPQLINVFIGDMSLVGPRPCLFSQVDLIQERLLLNVYNYKPGITGLAQVKNIDMSTPRLLAKLDSELIQELNLILYLKLILVTLLGKGMGDAIKN